MAIYSTFFVSPPQALEALSQPSDSQEAAAPASDVVSAEDNYAQYLEDRLPPVVRGAPHWCCKGLTNVELDPLARAIGADVSMQESPVEPPHENAIVMEIAPRLSAALATASDGELQKLAGQWAAEMSTPRYTHSMTGERLSDGWSATDAANLLQPLANLARQGNDATQMFLLIEW